MGDCCPNHSGNSIMKTYLNVIFEMIVLGSKTLGLNVLELQFVMLANHDKNV